MCAQVRDNETGEWIAVIVLEKPRLKAGGYGFTPARIIYKGQERLVPFGAFRNFYTSRKGKIMFKEYLSKTYYRSSFDAPTFNELLCAVLLLGKGIFTLKTGEKDIAAYWHSTVKEDCLNCTYHNECPVCIMNE